jgi:transposase InsO family protein
LPTLRQLANAFAKDMPNEKKRSATAFLKATLAYYKSLGVKVERVMTDNDSCYKSFAVRRLCKWLGLKRIRTKPYSPKTNGKAERFSQTCLRSPESCARLRKTPKSAPV